MRRRGERRSPVGMHGCQLLDGFIDGTEKFVVSILGGCRVIVEVLHGNRWRVLPMSLIDKAVDPKYQLPERKKHDANHFGR
jgi:hypothetical protein